MKIKTLKTVEELKNTIPTEEQIKNYKLLYSKLTQISFKMENKNV